MKPLLLPSVIIFGWVLRHNIKKHKSNDKEKVASFMKRDTEANFTRRKDLDDLPYVTIPWDTLPFDITLKDKKMQSQIDSLKTTVQGLSDRKMLNLIGISNTELKEQYGIANLEVLSYYDQNYTNYIRSLSNYAELIYEEYPAQAVQLASYCLEIGTDISSTYTLLAKHYLYHNQVEEFKKLYDYVPEKDSIAGKTIFSKLDSLKETTELF